MSAHLSGVTREHCPSVLDFQLSHRQRFTVFLRQSYLFGNVSTRSIHSRSLELKNTFHSFRFFSSDSFKIEVFWHRRKRAFGNLYKKVLRLHRLKIDPKGRKMSQKVVKSRKSVTLVKKSKGTKNPNAPSDSPCFSLSVQKFSRR